MNKENHELRKIKWSNRISKINNIGLKLDNFIVKHLLFVVGIFAITILNIIAIVVYFQNL